MRTVSEVAALAGVTVRTLHHYDRIALLQPTGRSEAGYRLYSYRDLVRLREILGWRRLGFPLGQIADLLDARGEDRTGSLERQRRLVAGRIDELTEMAAALDRALHGTEKEEEMFEGFDAGPYADEARERWGDTDAYRESARRTATYGEAEWREIKQESEAIEVEFAALFAAGEEPSGRRAATVAERHRAHISRWFYDCSPELHRGLGRMFVSDPRFARRWDERRPGLAQFVSDAFAAAGG